MTPNQPTHTTTEALVNLAREMRFLLRNNPKFDGGLYRQRLDEAEAALSTAPSGDGVPGMVLDAATIEACAKVADEKGFAVADTNADRYWQSVRISRAIRALAASSGETKP